MKKICSVCGEAFFTTEASCRAMYWHMRNIHKLDHDASFAAVGESEIIGFMDTDRVREGRWD